MIEARHLTRSFGGRCAVNDVSFRVERGTVAVFLGPNGAGKTTTLRLITGYLAPDAGSVRIDGHDIGEDPIAARRRFGYLPEAAAGFGDLSVWELLTFIGEARGLSGRSRAGEIARVVRALALEPALHDPLRSLSKGWRQRAWLAQAMIGDPPALILDEPTDGLDPLQQQSMRGLIREMGAGKAILLSTHDLDTAEALATRVIVMAAGRIVADAAPGELADGRGRLGGAFERLVEARAAGRA
jgi:ABC-2 type transport system ATP-binding protein